MDLLPTLLSVAGVEESADSPRFEGVNLWAFLETGSPLPSHLEAYSEVGSGGKYAVSLVSERWKLIYTKLGWEEDLSLYDLPSDPLEESDLSSEHADVTQSMLSRLMRTREAFASEARESTTRETDEATIETLRALGYVEEGERPFSPNATSADPTLSGPRAPLTSCAILGRLKSVRREQAAH